MLSRRMEYGVLSHALQDGQVLGSVHDLAVLLADGRIALVDGTPMAKRRPPAVQRVLRCVGSS